MCDEVLVRNVGAGIFRELKEIGLAVEEADWI